MPTLKLTQAAVERLKPPVTGRLEYWDSQLPGFGLRIAAPRQGKPARRTWQVFVGVKVAGKRQMVRETLGTMAEIPNVAEAREKARLSMAKARAGTNPMAEKRQIEAERIALEEAEQKRRENTLGAVIERYLAERPTLDSKGRPLASEYLAEIARTLRRDVVKSALGEKPANEVTRGEIRDLLADIVDRGRGGQANHLLSYLRTALKWAVDERLVSENVTAGIKPPAPKFERERALEDVEIKLFWRACEEIGWPFGPFGQLLLLLGCRRDELADATWGEFDRQDKKVWTLPGSRAKNRRPLITHLPQIAIDIVDRLPRIASVKDYVFTTGLTAGANPVTGFGRARENLIANMRQSTEVEWFTWHDLRRTQATGLASLGVAPHVIDKIQNHSTGKISGIQRIYNRFEYLPERKAALDAWAAHVAKLVGRNVVKLPTRA
jgi:integrase